MLTAALAKTWGIKCELPVFWLAPRRSPLCPSRLQRQARSSSSTIYPPHRTERLATIVGPGFFGFGPLYDSFSTGSSGFFFSSVSLLLKAANPADGGQYGLAIFADDSGSPGALIDPSNIKFDSDLSTSLEVVTFFPRILLAPNTRYWFGVEASPGASTAWSYSSDLSGVGVAGESWADTDAEGPTNVFSNATGHGPFQLAIASPEPATWAMMLVGFGGLGLAAFHRRRKTVAAR